MDEHAKRICELAEDAAHAEDGMSALRTLTELRQEAELLAEAHVERALAAGHSFADVARALGISRQAAHRRYRELAPERPSEPPRRLRATAEARAAVRLAREHAVAAGEDLRAKHVLLGILGTDGDAARALQAQGVTVEAAHACARAMDGDGARSDASDGDANLRRMLREAGRVALARGEERLGAEQLLLAALGDADDGARRTLAALGVTPASIRTQLGC
jgi:ATP-dependent Clp protease ATP-binding subunit ClpA